MRPVAEATRQPAHAAPLIFEPSIRQPVGRVLGHPVGRVDSTHLETIPSLGSARQQINLNAAASWVEQTDRKRAVLRCVYGVRCRNGTPDDITPNQTASVRPSSFDPILEPRLSISRWIETKFADVNLGAAENTGGKFAAETSMHSFMEAKWWELPPLVKTELTEPTFVPAVTFGHDGQSQDAQEATTRRSFMVEKTDAGRDGFIKVSVIFFSLCACVSPPKFRLNASVLF